MKPMRFATIMISVVGLVGCTGHTLREARPGKASYVQSGAIAVDARTDTVFTLMRKTGARKILYAVQPNGKTSRVVDLTGRTDIRVLFPASGVLVMSEADGREQLQLFDSTTIAPIRTGAQPVRYHGTRMSASRRWLAVADNTKGKSIHIIDTQTLAAHVIPHDGIWLEAMWLNNKSDRLIAIVFYPRKQGLASARILTWSMAEVAAAGYKAGPTGFWPKPELDIKVADVGPNLLFSFTWVGISPDDRWAVFPVCKLPRAKKYTCAHQLVVLDLRSKTIRRVANAKGPVGFTADSSIIVSYSSAKLGRKQQRLLLIDPHTLAVSRIEVPVPKGVTYFVTREGNYVVAASHLGNSRLVLVDLNSRKITVLGTRNVGFQQFVRRTGQGELWLVFRGQLFRLNVKRAKLESIATSYAPKHINFLPNRGWLVFDHARSNVLIFFDPAKATPIQTVTLPTQPK